MISSLSLCARVKLNLHNLNNEGTEGNQQQTRMVHILDDAGRKHVVNAISGDMFKHIMVEHLTPLLIAAKQNVCPNAAALHPDRILLDENFRKQAGAKDAKEIQDLMISNCAVTDIAGTLYAEKAVARKSIVEFGWVVGIPEYTSTEQYFHVKYDPSRGSGTGTESVAGTQAIFHRPASSGIYALVAHLELSRIGRNDISRKDVIPEADKKARMRAAIQALGCTLSAPKGAQRNTQFPHVIGAEGIIAISTTSVPAPTISPLNNGYREEIEKIAEKLSELSGVSIEIRKFDSLSGALEILNEINKGIE
ncbi:MAG: DevR family CRISPR-associated autoregulator [Armatimonadota bacterium]|nr:DevR family CRISPR-associated autoregulator [Armatimonadota bacterium]